MAITYRWNFDPLEVTYSSASLDNVVGTVHWQFYGTTEGTSSLGKSGSFQGSNIGTVNTTSLIRLVELTWPDLGNRVLTNKSIMVILNMLNNF